MLEITAHQVHHCANRTCFCTFRENRCASEYFRFLWRLPIYQCEERMLGYPGFMLGSRSLEITWPANIWIWGCRKLNVLSVPRSRGEQGTSPTTLTLLLSFLLVQVFSESNQPVPIQSPPQHTLIHSYQRTALALTYRDRVSNFFYYMVWFAALNQLLLLSLEI